MQVSWARRLLQCSVWVRLPRQTAATSTSSWQRCVWVRASGVVAHHALMRAVCAHTLCLQGHGLASQSSELTAENDPNLVEKPQEGTNARHRSLSELKIEGDGQQATGDDRSVIELAKRNIDNFQGLNPNSRDNVAHHSWSPECDRAMWPK